MTQKINREQVRTLKALLAEIDPDQIGESGEPIHLQQAYDEFMAACQARKLSVHTIEDYSITITKFIKHVGDMSMKNVTAGMVTAFLGSLNVSAKTTLNRHIGLAAWWTWALRQEYVDRHLIRLVDRPRPQKVVIEPFT